MELARDKTFDNIDNMREYIKALEGVLFNSDHGSCIDCLKLCENSVHYDPDYESSVRRNDLNLLYLLDEIVARKSSEDAGIVAIINEIETAILSPNFYRQLILLAPDESFAEKTKILKEKICKYSDIVREEISDKDYQDFISEFAYLNPEATKASFLDGLKTFSEHLNEKSEELESKIGLG